MIGAMTLSNPSGVLFTMDWRSCCLTGVAWPLWLIWSLALLQAFNGCYWTSVCDRWVHEDGLMDSCDGLVGGWDKEQRLSIMKDSRIGSYAALSIWFSLSLKWALLSNFWYLSPSSSLGFIYTLLPWCAVACDGQSDTPRSISLLSTNLSLDAMA